MPMTPVVSWCIHRYQTVAISLGYQACFLHSKKAVGQASLNHSFLRMDSGLVTRFRFPSEQMFEVGYEQELHL